MHLANTFEIARRRTADRALPVSEAGAAGQGHVADHVATRYAPPDQHGLWYAGEPGKTKAVRLPSALVTHTLVAHTLTHILGFW